MKGDKFITHFVFVQTSAQEKVDLSRYIRLTSYWINHSFVLLFSKCSPSVIMALPYKYADSQRHRSANPLPTLNVEHMLSEMSSKHCKIIHQPVKEVNTGNKIAI
jgi:hypothetical protein